MLHIQGKAGEFIYELLGNKDLEARNLKHLIILVSRFKEKPEIGSAAAAFGQHDPGHTSPSQKEIYLFVQMGYGLIADVYPHLTPLESVIYVI